MKQLSILIVEDDLSFALEIEILMREIGYSMITKVDNATAALHCIRTQTPQLILMDVNIKGELTGIEVAEQIQQLHIPVLFMTAFGQDHYYEQAKQTNCLAYLVKPIHKYTLRSSIDLMERIAF